MKIFATLFIIIASFEHAFGQFGCLGVVNEGLKTSRYIPNSSDYIPNISTPIKSLRVNIHFMLRSIGHANYPGNFTAVDDGNGNTSYTGYNYAEDIINTANSMLAANHKMNLPPGNSTAVIATKYKYVLNGVYFHEDNSHYFFPSDPNSKFGENIGECINVYFNNANGRPGGGHANMSGHRWTEIQGTWEDYIRHNEPWRISLFAGILNHEIGHNLSLLHPMKTSGGICCDSCDDYCSDTPTRGEIRNNFGFNPCCGWNQGHIATCSNNLMDCTSANALTPEQLGRVHWTIENEIKEYKTCFYKNSMVSITNFKGNKAFIGEVVSIPLSSSIMVNEKEALYINANEFEISGELEISNGSTFIVNTVSACY